MKVRIKKVHKDAVLPEYSHPGEDAGMDLRAVSREFTDDGCVTYDTGICIEIPRGYVGMVFPRSSISKLDLILSNSVGIIDSGYRDSIKCKFKTEDRFEFMYKEGDKIAQLIILPYPQIELEEVLELSASMRGLNGFGSTGN